MVEKHVFFHEIFLECAFCYHLFMAMFRRHIYVNVLFPDFTSEFKVF